MATMREQMEADAKANGFEPRAINDDGTNDRAQRAYIALKLFQIRRDIKRLADAAEINVIPDPDRSLG